MLFKKKSTKDHIALYATIPGSGKQRLQILVFPIPMIETSRSFIWMPSTYDERRRHEAIAHHYQHIYICTMPWVLYFLINEYAIALWVKRITILQLDKGKLWVATWLSDTSQQIMGQIRWNSRLRFRLNDLIVVAKLKEKCLCFKSLIRSRPCGNLITWRPRAQEISLWSSPGKSG